MHKNVPRQKEKLCDERDECDEHLAGENLTFKERWAIF